MPWVGDEYEGYIPLAALRERDRSEVVVMEVQYEFPARPAHLSTAGLKAHRSREPEPYVVDGTPRRRAWIPWFTHGISVGALIDQLASRRRGGVGAYFEDRQSLSERGYDDARNVTLFRIAVVGEIGVSGSYRDTPRNR